jgi:hypothetical protein
VTWRERMASKRKMAAQKTKDAPATEPKELAERFAQKRRGEPEREAKLAKLRQQQSTHKGKIALEKVVIPYLQKVQNQFYETTTLPEDFSFGVSQLDLKDQKPLGVYFRLAGGSTIVISIRGDGVITEKVDEKGQRDSACSKEEKPFIETRADLTEEKIGKLISMMIDEMSSETRDKPNADAPRSPSVQGGA